MTNFLVKHFVRNYQNTEDLEVRTAYGILAGHLGNTMSVAGGIVVGAIVYAILVLVLRIVSKDDLSLMPKGDKIAKLLNIK